MNKYILYIFLALNFLSFSQKKELKTDVDSNIVIRKLPDNFKDTYKDAVFVYDYNFDPNQRSLWEQFKHWLSKKIKEWFGLVNEQEAAKFTNSFIKILYYLVFITVLYFIIKTFMNKEGNWVFGRNSDSLNIKATVLKEELLETNYDTLIAKAKEKNDYRSAIRYHYLKILKELTKANLIEWDNEKTNYDYQYEIKNADLREEFTYISYVFDYCWYGEFTISESDFTEAEQKFNQLTQLING